AFASQGAVGTATPLQGAFDPTAAAPPAARAPEVSPGRGGRGRVLRLALAALLLIGLGGAIATFATGGEPPPAPPPPSAPQVAEPGPRDPGEVEGDSPSRPPMAPLQPGGGSDEEGEVAADLAEARRELDAARRELEAVGEAVEGREGAEPSAAERRVEARRRRAARRGREARERQRCVGRCRSEHHRCAMEAVGDGPAFHQCVRTQAECIAACRTP
ncbi:MAG TPA: hypothetical protein RMH99_27425, partial [Sandaracinaceae bacterium LLY-WYZ-13_1]|nr:hypothetical protein [Sandaracinaceae bacterium LLY-WYZ-13_1]